MSKLGKVGIFAEPAGATSYAGLLKALEKGIVTREDPVLILNTGSGLKDIKAAMQTVGEAPVIEPNLASVKRLLR
jgi:threonine synthase